MRVALVTETYPPEVNGVAMTLNRLVGGLSSRGHEIEVVRPRQADEIAGKVSAPPIGPEGEGVSQWLVPGVPIPFYKTLRMGLPVQGRLEEHWTESRPDVVHIATEGPLGLAALRAAQKLHVPATSSFHTNFHQYGGHYGLNFGRNLALRYLRWFHNQTACTMAPTAQICDQLAADGFQRMRVLSRGVDGKLFSPEKRSAALRTTWGANDDDPVVLYVGRMAAEKNLGVAVEAFLAMQALEPRAKFVLVGDGPERTSLAKKHPEFHYAGMRRSEDLAVHYASADLFVFPSVTETFGNVVTEAMASGLAVLAYDYAATRQHVRDGENGFTATFDDREAFLAAGRAVMGRREQWPAVRAGARATALTITWGAIFDRFESELRQAAGAEAVGAK